MPGTFIKICGITRVEDALSAARHGADAIGMVLHADSPRLVPTQRAREIVRELPAKVIAIGVFHEASSQDVKLLCGLAGVTHAQLHGGETSQELAMLRSLKLWRAVPVDGMFAHRLRELKALMLLQPDSKIEAIVLDTADPSAAGGTGRANDWTAVRAEQDLGHFDRLPPVVAAGGLNPDNVADVIRLIRPWGVDVSSGVEESEKGVKSDRKIEDFIRAVRAADEPPWKAHS